MKNTYAITGTYHGSIVHAYTEGEARRMFHEAWGGESILCVIPKPRGWYP